MSLILEALKKSEAERRLGQAPGLLSPAPAARRRHGLWPLLAVLVLAVGLSTAITWWLLRPDQAEPAAEAAVSSAAEDVANRRAASAPPRAPVSPQPQTPTSETAAAVAPVPATVQPDPAPAAAHPVRPAVERESAALPAGGALPEPPAPEPVIAAPSRSAGTITPPADSGAGARTAAPAATAARESATAATAGDTAAGPALPGLHALPMEVQSALPPLNVSMHVFNADPAQRFVLIDGRRYGEGMAVAEGLLLEAIRRDGVVLVFRGHRFLLPRPG
jgi:general secretion pathway protein B